MTLFSLFKGAYSAILLGKEIRLLIFHTIPLQMVLVRLSSLNENGNSVPSLQ